MDDILRLIKENPGKFFGGVLGLIIAILIVAFGFWNGIFIVLSVLAGIVLGAKIEKSGGFQNFLDKLWYRREPY